MMTAFWTLYRLKQDRRRQEQLAKERLEAARKKKKLGTIQEEEEEELDVVDNGDKAAMQVSYGNKFIVRLEW